jgi:hypothetical protein
MAMQREKKCPITCPPLRDKPRGLPHWFSQTFEKHRHEAMRERHEKWNSGKTWSEARYSTWKSRGTGYFGIARSRVTISRRASCFVGNVASRPILWVPIFHKYRITRICLETHARWMCFFNGGSETAILGKWRFFIYMYFWWKQNTCGMVVSFFSLDHLKVSVAEWVQKTICP